jgi:hypothetical protein
MFTLCGTYLELVQIEFARFPQHSLITLTKMAALVPKLRPQKNYLLLQQQKL